MLPEKIIDILVKYKHENEQKIINISKDIDDIIYHLNLINECISSELQFLLTKRNTDKANELYQDCVILCEYIDSINSLQVICSKEISDNKIKEILPDTSKDELKPVKLYLCEDNVCPECDHIMIETSTTYSHKINGVYTKRKIQSYKCELCGKYFIPDYDAVDINVTNTNLTIDTKHYNKITLFDDIYVITNINYHSSQNHKLEDIDGKLNIILSNGEVTTKIIKITYCHFCKKYYMLKSTYDNLQGIPICSIIDETKVKQENDVFFTFDSKGSKLTQYGYNVNCIDKLTDSQRHKILMIQLLSKNMQKNEIISILETNIERAESLIKNKSKRDMSNALRKWKSDKKFVSDVILDEYKKQIDIYRIILSYKKNIN